MCSHATEASWDSGTGMAVKVSPNSGLLRANALLEPLSRVYWPGLPVSSNQSRPPHGCVQFKDGDMVKLVVL